MSQPTKMIVIAWVTTRPELAKVGRADLGIPHTFREVLDPKAAVWLLEGTETDLLKAQSFVESNFPTYPAAFTYEVGTDPAVACKNAQIAAEEIARAVRFNAMSQAAADLDKPYADAYYAAIAAKEAANNAKHAAIAARAPHAEIAALEAAYLEAYDAVKPVRLAREQNMREIQAGITSAYNA